MKCNKKMGREICQGIQCSIQKHVFRTAHFSSMIKCRAVACVDDMEMCVQLILTVSHVLLIANHQGCIINWILIICMPHVH